MSNIELTWHTFKKQAFWKKEEPEPMPGDYLGRIYGGLAGGGVGTMGGRGLAKGHGIVRGVYDMFKPFRLNEDMESAMNEFPSSLTRKENRTIAMSKTAPTDMANKWREFLAKYKPGMENKVPDASHFSKLDKAMQKNMRRFGIGGAVLGIGGGVGLGALLDKHRKDSRRNSLNKRAFFGRKEPEPSQAGTITGGLLGGGIGGLLAADDSTKQLRDFVDKAQDSASDFERTTNNKINARREAAGRAFQERVGEVASDVTGAFDRLTKGDANLRDLDDKMDRLRNLASDYDGHRARAGDHIKGLMTDIGDIRKVVGNSVDNFKPRRLPGAMKLLAAVLGGTGIGYGIDRAQDHYK